MSELMGLYAIWYRELKVFFREKSRIIGSIIQPILWIVVFGAGLGASVSLEGINYQTYIFPGVLAMSAIFSSIFFGTYIVWDKKIDFLKEVLVAPVSRTTIFFGKVLGGCTDKHSSTPSLSRSGRTSGLLNMSRSSFSMMICCSRLARSVAAGFCWPTVPTTQWGPHT